MSLTLSPSLPLDLWSLLSVPTSFDLIVVVLIPLTVPVYAVPVKAKLRPLKGSWKVNAHDLLSLINLFSFLVMPSSFSLSLSLSLSHIHTHFLSLRSGILDLASEMVANSRAFRQRPWKHLTRDDVHAEALPIL